MIQTSQLQESRGNVCTEDEYSGIGPCSIKLICNHPRILRLNQSTEEEQMEQAGRRNLGQTADNTRMSKGTNVFCFPISYQSSAFMIALVEETF